MSNTEERQINDASLSLMEKFRLARFCYRTGIKYWDDSRYDKTLELLRKMMPTNRYVKTSYDDDDVPYDILERAGFDDADFYALSNQARLSSEETPETKIYRERMEDRPAKSIRPCFTWQACYDAFEAVADMELCISPKIDGCYGKALFCPDQNDLHQFRFAITKSRDSSSVPINITRNMSRLVPKTFDSESTRELSNDGGLVHDVILSGEYFCYEDAVPLINAKYKIDLVNGRTAGLSMIRTEEYLDEDYRHMDFVVHGVNQGQKLSDGYDWAESQGFTVVPYLLYTYESMDYEDFLQEISTLINKMKLLATELGYETDGLVVEINDRRDFQQLAEEGMYDGGNFAAKVGAWRPGIYYSTLREVVKTQKAARCSFRGIVDPVRVAQGQTVTTIGLQSPAWIVDNHLKIGSRICFQYKNNTTPLFICNADEVETLEQKLRELENSGGALYTNSDDELEEGCDDYDESEE